MLNDEILNESDDVEYSDEDLSEEFDELAREPLQLASTRSPELYANSLSNAVIAAKIADDLRGQDIVVLDMTHLTSIVDFFVIVTGNSRRQMHAIADEVNRKLKHEDGNRRFSIEGYRTEGNWILTDYGDVVLHVFTSEGRLLYNLEQLWADAKRIDWKGLLGSGAVNAGALNSGTTGQGAANTGTQNAEPG
ncbi:MAG: ribosome silencing factor [Planctomyces sp.]|nr:ribosome silencing factor [Planctomyces sp.]